MNPADEAAARRLELVEEVGRLRADVTKAEMRAQMPAIELLPHQIAPAGDWSGWCMTGGRGVGKSVGGAHWLNQHVMGPACDPALPGGHRVSIIGPTLGDALDSAVNGPKALKAQNPSITTVQTTGGTFVRWPSGAEGKLFGASTPDDVERLRAGGGRCAVWIEEFCALRRAAAAFEHMQYGLRVGPHPQWIITTTPKPIKVFRNIMADPTVVVSRGTTNDNPHLDQRVRDRLFKSYGGTRLGRQELYGEILEDIEGALWAFDAIDVNRRDVPRLDNGQLDLQTVVIGVDPGFSTAEAADETGIIVVGKGYDGHGYVIADRSAKASAEQWGRRVCVAFHEFEANYVIIETNLGGGELVKGVIRTIDPEVRVKAVRASRGKQLRAEPVSALYEQKRISHPVIPLDALEAQMTEFSLEDPGSHDDRTDALVYACTQLFVDQALVGSGGGSSMEIMRGREIG